MTIYTLIKEALQEINSDATIHVLDEVGVETESLNWSGVHIIIHPDFSSNIETTFGAEIINVTQYKIKFLTLDEWDNSTFEENSSSHTLNIINTMQSLANSVFWHIIMRPDVYMPSNAAKKWTSKPIHKQNNSTMSGVDIVFNFPKIDELICKL